MTTGLNNPLVRQETLRERVELGESLVAARLAEEFSVSLDTIRRDLLALEDAGAITRVRGGAVPVRRPAQAMHLRLGQEGEAVARIARAALPLIEDGMVLIFDGGTTTLALANSLPPLKNSLVVSPVPAIASATMEKGIETVLIGGRLSPAGGMSVGSDAEAAIGRVAADICFLGSCGLHENFGVGADDIDECGVKRCMVRTSSRTCVLTGAGKLRQRARHSVVPLNEVHRIITDAVPEDCGKLAGSGVEITYV